MGYLSRRGGWLSCHARSLTPFFGHAESGRGWGEREDRSSCRGRTISEEFRRQAVDLYESTPGATVRGIAADLRGGAGHATAVARGVRDRQLVRLPLPRRHLPRRPPTRPVISQATVIAVGVSALGRARSSACPSGTASRPTSGPSSSEACANAVSTPPELPGASSSMSSGVGEGIPTR